MPRKKKALVYRITLKPRDESAGVKVVVVWVEGASGSGALCNLEFIIPDLLEKMKVSEMEAI